MAARKNKLTLDENWRKKIGVGKIMDRLDQHIDGKVPMTSTQINAAKLVLSKMVPDLARTEHTGLEGGPLAVAAVDLRGLDDKDLATMHALLLKATQ